jgi:DNA-binding NarL/FixJ family response regulator
VPEQTRLAVDRSVHVLLADVPGAARRAVAGVLRALPGVAHVTEVGASDDVGRALLRTRANILVIDDRLLSGARIHLHDAGLPFVVIGLDDEPGFAVRARRLGATGWVPKERADEMLPEVLAEALERVGAGPP